MSKFIRIFTILAGLFFIVNSIMLFFDSNFNLGLVLVGGFGAFLVGYGFYFEKIKKYKLINVSVALALAVIIIFSSFLVVYGEKDNVDYTEKTVIVLGCGIDGDEVGYNLSKRLDKAIAYHEKNPDAMIIVSGGQGPDEVISEALAMKNYLLKNSIPEDKIIMEDKSTSTITNFAYSHEKMRENNLPDDSVVVVSNAYHIYRAVSYARAEGFEVTHLGAEIFWFSVPMSYFREILAVMKMWVFD